MVKNRVRVRVTFRVRVRVAYDGQDHGCDRIWVRVWCRVGVGVRVACDEQNQGWPYSHQGIRRGEHLDHDRGYGNHRLGLWSSSVRVKVTPPGGS